jgi:PHD/YefM family antitoxin component YafN of YafNO toxin-antitoxin module
MDYIAPISEVRGKLPWFLKKMASMGKYLIITKNGRAEAVVMTPEELETLEIKADPKLMQSLIKAQADLKAGRVYSHAEVFKNV